MKRMARDGSFRCLVALNILVCFGQLRRVAATLISAEMAPARALPFSAFFRVVEAFLLANRVDLAHEVLARFGSAAAPNLRLHQEVFDLMGQAQNKKRLEEDLLSVCSVHVIRSVLTAVGVARSAACTG